MDILHSDALSILSFELTRRSEALDLDARAKTVNLHGVATGSEGLFFRVCDLHGGRLVCLKLAWNAF